MTRASILFAIAGLVAATLGFAGSEPPAVRVALVDVDGSPALLSAVRAGLLADGITLWPAPREATHVLRLSRTARGAHVDIVGANLRSIDVDGDDAVAGLELLHRTAGALRRTLPAPVSATTRVRVALRLSGPQRDGFRDALLGALLDAGAALAPTGDPEAEFLCAATESRRVVLSWGSPSSGCNGRPVVRASDEPPVLLVAEALRLRDAAPVTIVAGGAEPPPGLAPDEPPPGPPRDDAATPPPVTATTTAAPPDPTTRATPAIPPVAPATATTTTPTTATTTTALDGGSAATAAPPVKPTTTATTPTAPAPATTATEPAPIPGSPAAPATPTTDTASLRTTSTTKTARTTADDSAHAVVAGGALVSGFSTVALQAAAAAAFVVPTAEVVDGFALGGGAVALVDGGAGEGGIYGEGALAVGPGAHLTVGPLDLDVVVGAGVLVHAWIFDGVDVGTSVMPVALAPLTFGVPLGDTRGTITLLAGASRPVEHRVDASTTWSRGALFGGLLLGVALP
jgi:hypothetical protein